MRPIIYRVRVRRAVEGWVDVSAHTPAQAELEAAKAPGVISVFPQSAIRGDLALRPEVPEGVRDE